MTLPRLITLLGCILSVALIFAIFKSGAPVPARTVTTTPQPISITFATTSAASPPSGYPTVQGAARALSLVPEPLRALFGAASMQTEDSALLHDYGNALAAVLQQFATAHADMIDVLKRQTDARTDPAAIAGVAKLADAYGNLAQALAHIPAPTSVQGIAGELTEDYRVLGVRLRAIAESSDDQSFLAAVNAENVSASQLVQRMNALVSIFKLHNVSFSASDAGYVFEQGY